MKKLLLLLAILSSIQTTLAFDFSDSQAKSNFCKGQNRSNTHHYNEKNDTCVETYTNGKTYSQDFRTFYCQNTGTSWLPYSYITKKCIGFEDIFDNSYSLDNKNPRYLDLINYKDKKGVSIQMQTKLSIIYKRFSEVTKDKPLSYTKKLEKKVINYIDTFVQKTKNEKNKYAFLLLKYEIENIYLQKKFGCKGKYCSQNSKLDFGCNDWYCESMNKLKYESTYYKKLKLNNSTELLLERSRHIKDQYYRGKTILKQNGKQYTIIDSFKYDEQSSLYSIDAQFTDDDNVFLAVCIGSGAGSGECQSLVFNLELSTKKLSFLGNWYYIPSSGLNLYTLKQYKNMQSDYQKVRIKSTKENFSRNKNDSEYKREYGYLSKLKERHKNIRTYFKQNHNIDIPYIEGDELIELLP